MSKNINLVPLILSGGIGSRLWPLSRESFPKQFINLNNEKYSLLQQTQIRLKGLNHLEKSIIVCNETQRFIVAEQMREIDIKPKSILLEPLARNTAPAITIGALRALQDYEEPYLLVLSADHSIKDINQFHKTIYSGLETAKKGDLVTFGVIPTSAEEGYGYIESQEKVSRENLHPLPIKKFIEKPDKNTAEKLIKDSRFTWNSGMFLFKAKSIINEIKKYEPMILSYCKESLRKSTKDLDFERIEKESFEKCKNISIDFAVMEKTEKGSVVPLFAEWSDLGSWESLWKSGEKDHNGNVIIGNVVADNVMNSYLRSEKRLIAAQDFEDLIVVETCDSIFVGNLKTSQKVKKIVDKLKKDKFIEGTKHRKIYRPWGHYLSIDEGTRWQIKKIVVNPEASLSLQMHHHRAEHWIVVKGTAIVELDDKKQIFSENQSTYIPLGSKHRLSNPGKIPLVLIEVQSGSYLGEDDIIRFNDQYGRIKPT